MDVGYKIGTQFVSNVDEAIRDIEKFDTATKKSHKELDDSFKGASARIAKHYGDLGSNVKKITQEHLDFAKVNNVDVSKAIDSVAGVLNAFNLTAKDSTAVMDTLTVASKETGITVDSLAESIVGSSETLTGLGVPLTDAIGMYASLEEAGIGVESTHDALRNTLEALKQPTDEQVEAFQRMGVALDKNNKPLEDNNTALRRVMDAVRKSPKDADTLRDALAIMGRTAGTDVVKGLAAAGDSVDVLTSKLRSSHGAVSESISGLSGTKEALRSMFDGLLQGLGPVGSGISGLISSLGGPLTVAAGAAAAAIGKLAIDGYNTQKTLDEAARQYQVQTGASREETEQFIDTVKQLNRSNIGTYDHMADAAMSVRKNYGELGDALGETTQLYMDFARVHGTDVDNALGQVKGTLDAFNIPLEQAGDLMDILTVASQKSGSPIDKLTGTVQRSAAAIQGLGIPLQDVIGLLATFESVGVSSERVNNAFKNSLTALEGASDSQADALRRLGVALDENNRPLEDNYTSFQRILQTIKDAPNEADVLNDALTVLGQNAGQQVVRAMRSGGDAIEEMMQALQQSTGATKDAVEVLDSDISVRWGLIKKRFSGVSETIGGGVMSALEFVVGGIEKLFALFGKMEGKFKEFTQLFSKIHSALFKWLADDWNKWGAGIAGFFEGVVSLLLNIFNAFAAAFTGDWEGFGEYLFRAWESLWDAIAGLLTSALSLISRTFLNMWEIVKDAWERVLNIFRSGELTKTLAQAVVDAVNWVIRNVPEMMRRAADAIMNAFRNALKRQAEQASLEAQTIADVPPAGGAIDSGPSSNKSFSPEPWDPHGGLLGGSGWGSGVTPLPSFHMPRIDTSVGIIELPPDMKPSTDFPSMGGSPGYQFGDMDREFEDMRRRQDEYVKREIQRAERQAELEGWTLEELANALAKIESTEQMSDTLREDLVYKIAKTRLQAQGKSESEAERLAKEESRRVASQSTGKQDWRTATLTGDKISLSEDVIDRLAQAATSRDTSFIEKLSTVGILPLIHANIAAGVEALRGGVAGLRTVNITVELDGRVLAEAVEQPLMDGLTLKLGHLV